MIYNGVELYEKNGKIGVLVSPGYGAGWSTWGCDKRAYDKRVVEFWLSHKDDEEFMATVEESGFWSVPESAAHKEAMEFFNSIGYESPYKRCSLYKRIMSLKTHGDLVREMSDEELSAWFWRMLKYTQGFTDSRSALDNWLKSPVEVDE